MLNSSFRFMTDGDTVIMFLSFFFSWFHLASDRGGYIIAISKSNQSVHGFSLWYLLTTWWSFREKWNHAIGDTHQIIIWFANAQNTLIASSREHHTWFISLNLAFRPSSDFVLHMSRIECADEKNPLFSLISIRFGSCEVRRLKLALVGVEDRADVKQQSTTGQKNEKKK